VPTDVVKLQEQRAVEKHISSILGKLRLPPPGDDHRRVIAVLTWLEA